MDAWRRADVWQTVAAELRAHRRAGLSALLTEDTVRFATARAFVQAGVEPGLLRVEWPHPDLKGSRIDLVVGRPRPTALIEFKFPREPNEVNAAWTMAMGEILKDLYRVAVYAAAADRLFVLVESARLLTYLARSGSRYGFDLDGDQLDLEPAVIAGLPDTATAIIGPMLASHHVKGRRLHAIEVDEDLRLSVFGVDPVSHATGERRAKPAMASGVTPSPPPRPRFAPQQIRRRYGATARGEKFSTRSPRFSLGQTGTHSHCPTSSQRCTDAVQIMPNLRSAPWSRRTCAATHLTTPRSPMTTSSASTEPSTNG